VSHRQFAAFFVACFAMSAACSSLAADKIPALGAAAADFQATTVDGKKLTLADFKGQVLVLSFWATWCAPCKKQLPLLDSYFRIQEAFGLRVVAVTNQDSLPLDILNTAAAALAIPMVRRFSGNYSFAGDRGAVNFVPINYVIDRVGVLRHARTAAWTLDDLNAILIPLLREHEGPGFDIDAPTGGKLNGE
jgi:cytochrome c biogenesis protein CcmG, thiol:disulfide interchange protein DsbE